LGESLAVGRVDGYVAEGCCAVVLDINIGRRKEVNEDRNGTSIDELLSVIIWSWF
jgi:hypothetical protein